MRNAAAVNADVWSTLMPSLSSMTGFARERGTAETQRWVWEIRSVNGRGLDLRFRWPSGLERLEPAVRKRAARRLSRGNMQISLILRSGENAAACVNTDVLSALVSQAQEHAVLDVSPGSIAQFMALPGVMGTGDASETNTEMDAEFLSSFDAVLVKLIEARQSEGAAILPLLAEAVDRIGALTHKASECASAQPAAINERIQSRMSELLADGLDADRLETEAALLAGKADVREELDRLRAHVEQAREHLAKGSPIGRKLDFLAQEFNRETNTLCSKSAGITLTQIGLEMKSAIEQFREQAANVE